MLGRFKFTQQMTRQNQEPVYIQVGDITGGINTRQYATRIQDNQVENLINVDLGVGGQRSKRLGISLVGASVGTNPCKELTSFIIQGNTDQLILAEGTNIRTWSGTGNFSAAIASYPSTTSTSEVSMISIKESGESPDDVLFIQNGTDNAVRLTSSGSFQDLGDTTNSPPKTLVNCWHANRVWCLKNDLLYYSDAYPSDYSSAFDRVTGAFRIPVGDEKAVISMRSEGLVVLGSEAVWAINPSTTPDPTTDKPEAISLNLGCVSRRSVVQVADDIYYLSKDGVRSIKRSAQDKLQYQASYPLSYSLKSEVDTINWAYADKACAIFFDNKYFIAVPVSGSTYNNRVWVFYPALNAWSVITGWNVGCWATYIVNGEERLYFGDATTGKVYRAWTGYTDNGSAIVYQEEGKKHELNNPLSWKYGATLEIRAVASEDTDVDVYAKFDEKEYEFIGKLNLNTEELTFPVTFPVTFPQQQPVLKKFSLDSYGKFKTIQIKLYNNDTNDELFSVIDYTIIAYAEPYQEAE